MAKRTPKHGTRKTLSGSISVFLVIIFAGFLLVTNIVHIKIPVVDTVL